LGEIAKEADEKKKSHTAFSERIRDKEYIAPNPYETEEDFAEELKFARDSAKKRREKGKRPVNPLEPSVIDRVLNAQGKNAVKLTDAFNQAFGTNNFDLKRWINTVQLNLQVCFLCNRLLILDANTGLPDR